MTPQKPKAPKSVARYTPKGTDAEHCGICSHYIAPNICSKVQGAVAAGGWCKYFNKAKKQA